MYWHNKIRIGKKKTNSRYHDGSNKRTSRIQGYLQSTSACGSFITVTRDCTGSPKFLSRQAESRQLEQDFAPYCIGIKHKYTTAYVVLNAPFFYLQTHFPYFGQMDLKKLTVGERRRRKKKKHGSVFQM